MFFFPAEKKEPLVRATFEAANGNFLFCFLKRTVQVIMIIYVHINMVEEGCLVFIMLMEPWFDDVILTN